MGGWSQADRACRGQQPRRCCRASFSHHIAQRAHPWTPSLATHALSPPPAPHGRAATSFPASGPIFSCCSPTLPFLRPPGKALKRDTVTKLLNSYMVQVMQPSQPRRRPSGRRLVPRGAPRMKYNYTTKRDSRGTFCPGKAHEVYKATLLLKMAIDGSGGAFGCFAILWRGCQEKTGPQ